MYELENEIMALRKALGKAKHFNQALVFFMDNPIMYQALEVLSNKKISAQHRLAFDSYNGLEWYRDELSEAINDYEFDYRHLDSNMPQPPRKKE